MRGIFARLTPAHPLRTRTASFGASFSIQISLKNSRLGQITCAPRRRRVHGKSTRWHRRRYINSEVHKLPKFSDKSPNQFSSRAYRGNLSKFASRVYSYIPRCVLLGQKFHLKVEPATQKVPRPRTRN